MYTGIGGVGYFVCITVSALTSEDTAWQLHEKFPCGSRADDDRRSEEEAPSNVKTFLFNVVLIITENVYPAVQCAWSRVL